MGLVFLMRGNESNSIVIADDPKNRVKNLAEGEVGIANYQTGTHFIMKENGDWDIQVNGNVNLTATGDANITVGGNCTINAEDGEIFLNSPVIRWRSGTIDINGVTVNNGDVNVTNGDVLAETISVQTHVHGGVTAGSGSTGDPEV